VDYRAAFFRVQDNLWNKIVSRNQITQMQEGFFTPEIPAFNERVIKEIILNAVTHRDYRKPGSIIIKQSPQEFEIQSPGGFVSGVTPENILNRSVPRNRLLAEALQHVGLVQRAGQGMDTVFEATIKEGKGIPDFSGTDDHHVILLISAQVKNPAFLQYLERVVNEKQVTLSIDEMVLLQKVEQGEEQVTKKQVQHLLDIGIVEPIGRTKGTRYLLSHNYYTSKNKQGEYTRLKGLSREVKKQLILEHLQKNIKGASLREVASAFPDLKRKDVSNLLQELRREGRISKSGDRRWAHWKLDI
jgi:ATP-dependent DNA helicase RecG